VTGTGSLTLTIYSPKLPAEARAELDQLAREITVRDSMIYQDGRDYSGPGPGLRTETRGRLMISYLTDIRASA
jgi:hypothetical protein